MVGGLPATLALVHGYSHSHSSGTAFSKIIYWDNTEHHDRLQDIVSSGPVFPQKKLLEIISSRLKQKCMAQEVHQTIGCQYQLVLGTTNHSWTFAISKCEDAWLASSRLSRSQASVCVCNASEFFQFKTVQKSLNFGELEPQLVFTQLDSYIV